MAGRDTNDDKETWFGIVVLTWCNNKLLVKFHMCNV